MLADCLRYFKIFVALYRTNVKTAPNKLSGAAKFLFASFYLCSGDYFLKTDKIQNIDYTVAVYVHVLHQVKIGQQLHFPDSAIQDDADKTANQRAVDDKALQ